MDSLAPGRGERGHVGHVGVPGPTGEVRVVDPKTGGEKGSKPERFGLLPPEALEELARVFAFGAEKYDDHNYLKGFDWSLSIDALHRHIAAWTKRESTDAESGLSHLMHAGFHLIALYMFELHGLGTDDRWRPPAPEPKLSGREWLAALGAEKGEWGHE